MMPVTNIADSYAFIAMLNTTYSHHKKTKEIIKKAEEKQEKIVFPATAITEALTTMKFKFPPEIVKEAAEKVAKSTITIISIDAEILKIAVGIFDQK